jgi:para-nitrobenzyl esterase
MPLRRGLTLAVAGCIAGLLAGCAGHSSGSGHRTAADAARRGPAAPLVVGISDGRIRGKLAGQMDDYLGIPYAAPPVGRLRWRPPEPATHWAGIRSAASFGPHCPQAASPFGRGSTTENCLFLNVYAPARGRGTGLPVMVWLHGGGFVGGESNDYNPSGLVAHGVIVVTLNYRLGALGFLADSALAGRPGGPTGDYGLMDQQAALHWVQRNIGAFGGNPANVTLFGESAGGQSTLLQLTSPGARGLFAKAIVESGGYALEPLPLAQAESQGKAFAAKVGCASQSARCLRRVPVARIVADQNQSGASADIDGTVLTEPLRTALATGKFSHVPVINGSNHDEWRLFVALAAYEGHPVTQANYLATIGSTLRVPGKLVTPIALQYPLGSYPSPPLAMSAVGTDAIFSCPALLLDQDMARYTPVYAYEFNDEHAPSAYPPQGLPYAAAHAAELQYLFGLPTGGKLSASQLRLSAAMQAEWTSFAKAGVPSAAGAARWPRFTPASQDMLSLVPPEPRLETDFGAEHHCSFWALGGD